MLGTNRPEGLVAGMMRSRSGVWCGRLVADCHHFVDDRRQSAGWEGTVLGERFSPRAERAMPAHATPCPHAPTQSQ